MEESNKDMWMLKMISLDYFYCFFFAQYRVLKKLCVLFSGRGSHDDFVFCFVCVCLALSKINTSSFLLLVIFFFFFFVVVTKNISTNHLCWGTYFEILSTINRFTLDKIVILKFLHVLIQHCYTGNPHHS